MERDAFAYCSRPENLGTSGAFVARIPSGPQSKAELLKVVAERLQLPHWFGHNWDALDECLNDFAWLDTSRVVVFHEDVPAVPEPELTTYLQVLADAASRWQDDGELDLVVAFPVAAVARLGHLLGAAD